MMYAKKKKKKYNREKHNEAKNDLLIYDMLSAWAKMKNFSDNNEDQGKRKKEKRGGWSLYRKI